MFVAAAFDICLIHFMCVTLVIMRLQVACEVSYALLRMLAEYAFEGSVQLGDGGEQRLAIFTRLQAVTLD